jgi:hypothetical protein
MERRKEKTMKLATRERSLSVYGYKDDIMTNEQDLGRLDRSNGGTMNPLYWFTVLHGNQGLSSLLVRTAV